MDTTYDPRSHVVLATHNKGKVAELAELLAPLGLTVLGMDSFPQIGDVEETGTSFEENARLKARTVAEATGLVALADDSGLEVDALGKAPGVYSARYSRLPNGDGERAAFLQSLYTPEMSQDERNIVTLLHALQGIPKEQRTARFRCCMAACAPDGEALTADGAWEGLIQERPEGTNGFGYDPVFYDPRLGATAASLGKEEKNRRSHRAEAVQALLRVWPAFWAAWVARVELST